MSYKYFTWVKHKIILVDDSHQNVGTNIQKTIQDCDVLVSLKPIGSWAELYINLSNTYRYALNFEFKALLKLDTDALVIGDEPDKEALKLFEYLPTAGTAGQYPSTYSGEL